MRSGEFGVSLADFSQMPSEVTYTNAVDGMIDGARTKKCHACDIMVSSGFVIRCSQVLSAVSVPGNASRWN